MHAESFQQQPILRSSRAHFFVSLKSKKSIESLFKNGGKVFGRYLMLRFERSRVEAIPRESPEVAGVVNPPFAVVFAVSKKTGDAHRRNRAKRRLREALFALLKAGEVKQSGFDLAIIPKSEATDLPFADLCRDLKTALQRLPKHRDVQGASTATDGGLRTAPKHRDVQGASTATDGGLRTAPKHKDVQGASTATKK